MEKPEKILATALTLFVNYGFHGTPTSRIAHEAGVSNGTLFHYFKTKDELVVALYHSIRAELNQYLADRISGGKTPKEKFQNLFVGSVEWGLEHSDAFYFIQQFHFSPHLGLVPEESRQQTAIQTQVLEEAGNAHRFKPLPIALIATLSTSQMYGTYQYLMAHPLPPDARRQWLNDVFELTWTMVANPEAP
ncbi:TetR/AcrR family transcriptional regulator [Larkinella bovis]|uniref:TetR/AcrR family transcriptional regulator n=1 Tax=Larkinella bovis TaxID=683041 RepID=A0ABW0IFQ2_9BACT